MSKRVQYWSIALLLAVTIFAAALPTPARADGIIIPTLPPCRDAGDCQPTPMGAQLAIRFHRVKVTIDDQLAVTRVDQVFYNPNEWSVEGSYLFPLPAEAAVTSFSLWVDGQPVEGQVLDAEQARSKYHEIVSQMRDPALLEYAGRGAVQANIFPIPPHDERRIELEYTQVLAGQNSLVRYTYPLSTEKFSAQLLEQVSISLEVRAATPIRAVYSPSHPVDMARLSETEVRAGYEAQNVKPDTDFSLYYSLGVTPAFHLLTFRDSQDSDPDGFFLLLLAPQPDETQAPLPKDVLFVLDRSGSMEGEKFSQVQQALRYTLQHLNPQDRFNVIAFSTGLERYADGLRLASEAGQAVEWTERLSAQGSTDINLALLDASAVVNADAEAGRPVYLIFLTDGLPTEGVVESQQILENFKRQAPPDLRLFTFGVGYDVDTFLLDSLAQPHHGASSYVLPGERLDERLSDFYARISAPVMTDLALDFGDLPVYDLYPSPLPDLFRGGQIVLAGRYGDGGATTVTLTGKVNGEPRSLRYEAQTFARDVSSSEEDHFAIDQEGAFIARLWATRKIGYLLNLVRLEGPEQETIDQIVRLSIRYGIVTPYTSYLVTEPLPLGAAEQERIAEEQLSEMQAEGTAPPSGAQAVQKAADQGSLAGAEAPAAPQAEAANVVRIIGSRAFVLRDEVWIDTAYDPDKTQTKQVLFLSGEYFDLADEHPELAAAFALGARVLAISGGTAYEVVAAQLHPDSDLLRTPQANLKPTFQGSPGNMPVQLPSTAGGGEVSPGASLPCPEAALLAILAAGLFGMTYGRRSAAAVRKRQ
jgi:Ca-activated chloride channel family protein